ncbi:multidrug resistance protein [Rickettsiales bacterium]|nr:multidrug resistance protein [Rickettsiales bacterium]
MHKIIDKCAERSRAVLLALATIFILGIQTYSSMPKEKNPDVQVPFIYVSASLQGMSPEDGDRLVASPLERELRSIEGAKEIKSISSENHVAVIIEFQSGFNSKEAMEAIRSKVDDVKPDLPKDLNKITINEINFSLFPVVNLALFGDIPENTLISIARNLRNKIESIPEVLGVNIAGERKEILEISIDPSILEGYNLNFEEVIGNVINNNVLIASGSIVNKSGEYAVKIPGLITDIKDVLNMPVKSRGDAVVKFSDIAQINLAYEDPESFARINGKPALVLEVSKRTGTNLIKTIDKIKQKVSSEQALWPKELQILYAQDTSQNIIDMLGDLENNLLFATILVILIIMFAMGIRSAALVAISVPASFLIGVLIINYLGYTMNMVVLFSLILATGMLVDASIVVTEYADRLMISGISKKDAYKQAAKHVCYPVISSTLTTVVVFLPLLFWPGIVGQFMKYLPTTLIGTLTGSLLASLIFIPAIGSWIGKPSSTSEQAITRIKSAENADFNNLGRFSQIYYRMLSKTLERPLTFALSIISILGITIIAYAYFSVGTEFFPDSEPENALIRVKTRGNLSIYEKDEIMRDIEAQILDMQNEVKVFYAKTGGSDHNDAEDVIGKIQLEFVNWQNRRKAQTILQEMQRRIRAVPGIITEAEVIKAGPPTSKDIQIEISSNDDNELESITTKILEIMKDAKGILDIEDSRPVPAIEWKISVDREAAAKFNVNINQVGNAIKLVTNGIKISSYNPDFTDNEVDILLRFAKEHRNLKQLDQLRINTAAGPVPISNLIKRTAQNKLSKIERVNGNKTLNVSANVAPEEIVDNKIKIIAAQIKQNNLEEMIKFKGEKENEEETASFLKRAFLLSLLISALIILIQFNSVSNTLLIMSAVFLSTTGVLIGLLVTGRPFSIVMCGVGLITLAGIVVNNNILLVDTYKHNIKAGMEARAAIVCAALSRLRAVLLTAGTTTLGLLPMAAKVNIDFFKGKIIVGGPMSQFWALLATSIAGGLTFATILTLFFTPVLLILGNKALKNTNSLRQ